VQQDAHQADHQRLLRGCTEVVLLLESNADTDRPAQRDLLGTSCEDKRHSGSENAALGSEKPLLGLNWANFGYDE
jgi:hypothetical protein